MDAATDTQALLGEQVNVFQVKDGWAFVQLVIDSYVGFMPARCLTSQVLDPTHRIAVPSDAAVCHSPTSSRTRCSPPT